MIFSCCFEACKLVESEVSLWTMMFSNFVRTACTQIDYSFSPPTLGWYGMLGTGSTSDLYEPPTSSIDLGDDFMTDAINCGAYHCCAVATNKTLKCWGQ